MIADSGILLLLTQAAVLPRLPIGQDIVPASFRTVRLDADWPEIAGHGAGGSG